VDSDVWINKGEYLQRWLKQLIGRWHPDTTNEAFKVLHQTTTCTYSHIKRTQSWSKTVHWCLFTVTPNIKAT